MTKLEENYSIANCDDLSKDVINIVIKTSRGQVDTMSDADILKFLELTHTESEIMNLTDFYQTSIVNTSFPAVIKTFTNWRLGYYKNRYENLLRLIDIDIQRYIDIITAIKFNIGGIAKKTLHRSNLTDFLIEIGVVHTDYISALPIYRLTDEERLKTEAKLQEAQVTRNDYLNILSSDERRSKIYISELKDVLKNYG
jgi:DNA gyrase/topoisomerase IV subunit A